MAHGVMPFIERCALAVRANGICYAHAGEGAYDVTKQTIRQLLAEPGVQLAVLFSQ
jgi:hypothetical protein